MAKRTPKKRIAFRASRRPSTRTPARSRSRTRNEALGKAGKKKAPRASKHVYWFGDGTADGDRTKRNLLGGKGANLAEMSRLGFPVPGGFTISTEVCTHFYANRRKYPAGLELQVQKALAKLERSMKKQFGDEENPLLVSVRSGARVSMPGMMDTVLNLGLNDRTVLGLAKVSGNPRFAWDSYRRFVHMFGNVVLGVKAAPGEEHDPFGAALDALKETRGVQEDVDLSADDMKGLVRRYKQIIRRRTKKAFPEDPVAQLWLAIGAVFESWKTDRADAYRAMNDIPSEWGTAVNIVAMVYGNLGEDSGTGVAFTRDPSTGEKRFYGEYLRNAQGEDVVAGIRTPQPILTLKQAFPQAWRDLQRIQKLLERHFRDMQDIEFTIEKGRLFMLQCRAGKRTGFAAVRIAVDMVREGLISKAEALQRVEPESLNQLLQPLFRPSELRAARQSGRVLTRGLNAGPGAATGRVVFTPKEAEAWAARGETVILARVETSPEDIRGMEAAVGILTARGGMTSHAALVARQMGKVCIAGAGEVEIDYAARRMTVGKKRLREGDWISLDGTTGELYEGRLDTEPSEINRVLFGRKRAAPKKGSVFDSYSRLMRWADEVRQLAVRTNADQPDQARVAIAFGAEGIGLCRTEHMFFGGKKIDAMREMILADTKGEREGALAKLLPLQRKDFEGIFKAMDTRPVTIRTLDPPLHEFLPHEDKAQKALARKMGLSAEKLRAKVESLSELNPMLGHRGCRLGITYPEITAMQARAIFEAACNVAARSGRKPRVEVMIPLIGSRRELELQEEIVREVADEVFRKKKMRVPYLVGTMIELPRAALTAGDIAEVAEFFSFGTNDLTQTTYGISRDDGSRFVPEYIEREIMRADPFATLDTTGVGRLMELACTEGKHARPDIKLGICGEHGGDPASVEFCHELGLDYVSCSPYRVPIARLAAAQAALRGG